MDARAFQPVPRPSTGAPSTFGWNTAHLRCHGLAIQALQHVLDAHDSGKLETLGLDAGDVSLTTPDADIRISPPGEDERDPTIGIMVTALQDMPIEIVVPVVRWNPDVVERDELALLAAKAARGARDQLVLVESTLNTPTAAEHELRRWAKAHLTKALATGISRPEDQPGIHLWAAYAHSRPRLDITSNGLSPVRHVAVDARPLAPDVGERRSLRVDEDQDGDGGPLRSVSLHPLSAYASHGSLPESPVDIARLLREFDLPDLRPF